MSNSGYTPIVVLFEDRPKQSMVFQLNLSIYLDARVTVVTDLKELKKVLASPDGLHLVIARSQIKGAAVVGRILEFLKGQNAKVPVICLGPEKERPEVTIVGDDSQVKPMLQAAAKILQITAQQMVSKQRPDTYEIMPDFLKLLFTFPCDIFDRNEKGMEKVFSAGETVARKKVTAYVNKRRPLVINSLQRLKLTNAVTEQSLKAAAQLEGAGSTDKEKMTILSASIDMVAAQFQNAGMDEETVKLANASIKAVEKIAASATSVGNLVKQLMEAEGGYRYAHCQLLTFLGFHVIKMMGWWGDEPRDTFSQACFYHDISLGTDEDSRVNNMAELALKDPAKQELILTHAQLAAREMQTSPDISPEVVRLVLQHHGSPNGRGFSDDLAKLDNLAKTFVLGEKWADYLIHLSDTNQPPDNEGKIAQLKELFKKDETAVQIIETFRYLDPSQFTSDFLEAPKIDLTMLNRLDEPEADTIVGGAEAQAEASTKISGVTEQIGDNTETKVKGRAGEAAEEKKIKGGAAAKEESKTIRGATEKIGDNTETTVPGGARELEKEAQRVRAGKGEEAEDSTAVSLKGTKAAAEGEIRVGGTKNSGTLAEQKMNRVHGDHGHDEERILVKGSEAEVDRSQTKVDGVTLVHKDEEIKVKGGNNLDTDNSATKLEGTTEHRVDEKIVVKGDPQNYVDRSITKVKADPEKERELKMKQLSGCTDLMKAALSNSLEKVQELMAAGVELRKTDAEGRTAIHYAAMGGSIPILKVLAEKGVALNGVDSKRRSALFLAAMHKHNEAFDYLMSQGAKINQQALGGMTIAMLAAFSNNMHILQMAVEKGVRLDTREHSGKTALDFAKQAKAAEAIAYIEAKLAAKPAAPAKAQAAAS